MTRCSPRLYLSLYPGESTGTIDSPLQCTLVISIAFFFVFSAFQSVQALQSSLNMEEGLGVKSLACVYASTIISSLLAPFLLKLLGGKPSILIAFFIHMVYIGSNFYPTFYTLLPSSFLLGLVTGPLWTSQSMFITTSATSISQKRKKSLLNVLNRHNGIFFSVIGMAFAIGSVVSSVIFRNDINFAGYNYTKPCGMLQCDDITNKETFNNSTATGISSILKPSPGTLYQLYAVYLTFDVIGVIVVALFLPPLPKSDWIQKKSALKSTYSMLSLLKDSKMVLMLPYIVAVGFQRFFLFAEFSKAYVSCPYGVGVVGLVMATYASTNTIIMQLLPKIMKHINSLILIIIATLINFVCMILWTFWNPTPDHVSLVFISAVLWGFADSIFRLDIYGSLPILFADKKEPAFANLHFWRGIFWTIFLGTASQFCVYTKLIFFLSFLMFSMVLYGILKFKVRHLERKQSDIDIAVIEKEALNKTDIVDIDTKKTIQFDSIQTDED